MFLVALKSSGRRRNHIRKLVSVLIDLYPAKCNMCGGAGKQELGERKPPKGYREGVQFGKKTLAKELKSIIDKHLTVRLKEGKQGNKVSEKQLEKFNRLLDEKYYGGGE